MVEEAGKGWASVSPKKTEASYSHLATLFEDAMESLRKARRHITDEEGKQLLYHAGMTIRTLQRRYDPIERNESHNQYSNSVP